MTGISFGVLPSGALAGAERSEGERSEPQRSGAAAKAGAGSLPVWFAKTLADFEINDIAALPPLFCYNS